MTRAALIALALAAVGCRTRPLDTALPGGDGGTAAACATHTRQVVPLAGLDAISTASASIGQSARAVAAVELRPCDVPADFTVDVQPGNATDFVTLTAHAWVSSLADCGPAALVKRAVELEASASNPIVDVRDGAPDSPRALTLSFRPPVSISCALSAFPKCDNTCQCMLGDPRTHCLPSPPGGGPTCARPCAEDVQCGGGLGCVGDSKFGPAFSCRTIESPCCAQTCGFGQRCDQSCLCVVAGQPTSGPCTCDTDCVAGAICSDQHRCLNPCAVVEDCPGPDAATCSDGICSYFVN